MFIRIIVFILLINTTCFAQNYINLTTEEQIKVLLELNRTQKVTPITTTPFIAVLAVEDIPEVTKYCIQNDEVALNDLLNKRKKGFIVKEKQRLFVEELVSYTVFNRKYIAVKVRKKGVNISVWTTVGGFFQAFEPKKRVK